MVTMFKLGLRVLAIVVTLVSRVTGHSSSSSSSSGNLYCETSTFTNANLPNYTRTTTYTSYRTYSITQPVEATEIYTIYTSTVTKIKSATIPFTFWTTKASRTITIPTRSDFTPFASATVVPPSSNNTRVRRWQDRQRNGIAAVRPRAWRAALKQSSSSSKPIPVYATIASHKTTSCDNKTTKTTTPTAKKSHSTSTSAPQTLVATQVLCTTTITLPATTETEPLTTDVPTTAHSAWTETLWTTVTRTTHRVQTTDVSTVYAACYDAANLGNEWHGEVVDHVWHEWQLELPPAGWTPLIKIEHPRLLQAAQQSPLECCNAAFRLRYAASGVSALSGDGASAFVYYGAAGGEAAGACSVDLPARFTDDPGHPFPVYFDYGTASSSGIVAIGTVGDPIYELGS